MNLTKEKILENIAPEWIFERYLNIKVDKRKKYLSPFRPDKSPTCSFYKAPHGVLYFKDWATGDTDDCFSAVMKIYSCNFFEALKIIDQDFGLGLYTNSVDTQRIEYLRKRIIRFNQEEQQKTKNQVNFSCSIQDFSENALAYWAQFNITKEILELFNVYEVTDVRKENLPYWRASFANPIYGYFFEDRVKFYRPLGDKENKWRGNVTKEDIYGLQQLPESGETLIVTKSLKDVMTLYSLGYNAIAPQAESSFLSEKLVNQLKTKWKNIIILFDNDKEGIKNAKKFSKEFNIPYVTLTDAKDISDLVKLDKEKAIWQIKELIKQNLEPL